MVNRTVVFSLALASSLLTVQPSGALAQGEGSSGLRAANLARMKAEILNGGLQVYRAAAWVTTLLSGRHGRMSDVARWRHRDAHAGRVRRDLTSGRAGPEGWSALTLRPSGRVRGLELLFPGTTVG